MYKGHCTCKYLSYEILCDPMFVNCCHCTWCQRETGSAFVINAVIETSNVRLLSGEPEKILTPSESGKGQQVFRCPKCKIALWSNYGGVTDKIRFVRVGSLENPANLPPLAHIFVRSKLPWVILSGDIPAFDIFYDYEKMWTKENLKRREDARK
jgi:hypothetical protein